MGFTQLYFKNREAIGLLDMMWSIIRTYYNNIDHTKIITKLLKSITPFLILDTY